MLCYLAKIMHNLYSVRVKYCISPLHSAQELLLLVLSAFIHEYGPVLIILEDIHLLDTVSLQLMANIVNKLPSGCLLVASRRPNAGIFDPAFGLQVPRRFLESMQT